MSFLKNMMLIMLGLCSGRGYARTFVEAYFEVMTECGKPGVWQSSIFDDVFTSDYQAFQEKNSGKTREKIVNSREELRERVLGFKNAFGSWTLVKASVDPISNGTCLVRILWITPKGTHFVTCARLYSNNGKQIHKIVETLMEVQDPLEDLE
jgi:hypothetical protein